jgi:hypothetical protein
MYEALSHNDVSMPVQLDTVQSPKTSRFCQDIQMDKESNYEPGVIESKKPRKMVRMDDVGTITSTSNSPWAQAGHPTMEIANDRKSLGALEILFGKNRKYHARPLEPV